MISHNKTGRYYTSPILWARFGWASRIAAKVIRPASPPILIMSLPRSGSSWVGDILGSARNALYLREPITQSNRLHNGEERAIINDELIKKSADYQAFADDAFCGLPAFRRGIVTRPEQWSIRNRLSKKVVIKEVNPLSLKMLLNSFRPKLIFLVRHPAAVARSYKKLGWVTPHMLGMLKKEPDSNYEHAINEWVRKYNQNKSYWLYHGGMQGLVLTKAMLAMIDYEDKLIIRYEDLCASPTESFRLIFKECGLAWDVKVAQHLRERTSKSVSDHPYSTFRNSSNMIGSWKDDISERDLQELQTSYLRFCLPWYSRSEDW